MHSFVGHRLCPMLRSVGDHLDGRGYVANLPTCGPLLTLSPAVKRRGPGSFHPSLSEVEALLGGSHYMSRFQICRRNDMSSRRAILGTSPPRVVSQIVLRLWCITGGQPRRLSVRIGTQWV